MTQRVFSACGIQTGPFAALIRSYFVPSKKLFVPQTFLAAVRQARGHGLGVDEAVADSGTLFRGREAEVDKELDGPVDYSLELELCCLPHCM